MCTARDTQWPHSWCSVAAKPLLTRIREKKHVGTSLSLNRKITQRENATDGIYFANCPANTYNLKFNYSKTNDSFLSSPLNFKIFLRNRFSTRFSFFGGKTHIRERKIDRKREMWRRRGVHVKYFKSKKVIKIPKLQKK